MSDGHQCVACGAKIELFGNHHCSQAFENRRQGIDRRSQEHVTHTPAEAARLNYGFYLLSLRGGFGDALSKRA
jgi:hypothetical protein